MKSRHVPALMGDSLQVLREDLPALLLVALPGARQPSSDAVGP